jgi:type VI secretion system protein ImpA
VPPSAGSIGNTTDAVPEADVKRPEVNLSNAETPTNRMAAALLDYDALLAPLPGDNPAGEPVAFTTRRTFEDKRKEVRPTLHNPDDYRDPDWDGIRELAEKILRTQSKDLMVAARLTEALTLLHDFAGLNAGLQLMHRLVVEAWDRIHPEIEDGDLEVRATPFNWLDDPARGALFPNRLRTIPILRHDEKTLSWQQWRDVQDAKNGAMPQDELDALMVSTTREHCSACVDAIKHSQATLNDIATALDAKLGDLAPTFVTLREALTQCLLLAEQVLDRKGGPALPELVEAVEVEVPPTDLPTGASGPVAVAPPAPRSVNRDDIYRQLTLLADQLQKLEPNSPIPYLIQRAVRLGMMPFPQMLRKLIRQPEIVADVLDRDLDLPVEMQ